MRVIIMMVCAALLLAAIWLVIELSPLFLNSKITRIHEKNLPRITIEKGNIVYCRMKADDFRFPLPPGSRAQNPILTSGGFDTVDGSVGVRFEGTNRVTADDYQEWLQGKIQVGGYVTARSTHGGIVIEFHYFGDR